MAKRKGRPPKIDESGREILREIVTAPTPRDAC